jgi:hypothetical protein
MRATLPWMHSLAWRPASAVAWAALAILIALLLAAAWALPPSEDIQPKAVELQQPLTPAQRQAQQQCAEGALLMHDVRWAAACKALADRGQGDGHAECDLPAAESGLIYRQLLQSEQQCLADARTLGR